MGIVKNVKEWIKSRRLTRLENDLNLLRDKLNFNPKFAYSISELETTSRFTCRLEEYRIWYAGDSRMLRELYAMSVKEESLNYFWFRSPPYYRRLHCGIPGLISSKMATVLFGSGYDVEVKQYNEDGTEDEAKSASITDSLLELIKQTNVDDMLEKGAQFESWSGHLFVKMSHDAFLSDYPIIEIANLRNAEAIKERGITTAIIFKHWYKHNKKEYRLDEIYTTSDDNDAMIIYKLFQLKSDGELEVGLFSIPQIMELGLPEDGYVIFEGLKGMLAFEKPNRLPSHEFMESNYGASDYEGALDSFDALDEAYSELIAELRNNKTLRYTPSSMLKKDANGNPLLDQSFITNFMITESDIDQNNKDEIKVTHIQDKTEHHKMKFTTALTTAINNAGLSPFALGITGLESINASAESQQERNKVTIETRNKKIKKWQPFTEKFFLQMICFYSWMRKNTDVDKMGIPDFEAEFDSCDVKVRFGEYMETSQKSLNEIWTPVKMAGGISLENYIERINPDMDRQDVLDEVNRIRFEQGMALDDPMGLPELTGVVEEEEDE